MTRGDALSNSSKSKSVRKPAKPRKDFPLFPHGNGYWAKKVRGKIKYFGKVSDDPKGVKAEALWNEQKDDLLAGRKPRKTGDGLTIRELCNRFLNFKLKRLKTGEITARTFHDYKSSTDRLIAVFGKNRLVDDLAADDFEQLRSDISETRRPVALANEIGRIRVIFNFGVESGLTDKATRYGHAFKKPSKKTIREDKKKNAPRWFDRDEVLMLLSHANSQLKAMILLALNSGFGNTDIGNLPISALDLDAGWIDFPRPKTAIDRRVPLWEITVEALREVLENRPVPLDEGADNVFLTKYRQPWVKAGNAEKVNSSSPISAEFRKLCKQCDLYKRGRSFYSLRHVFETIGGDSLDQVAVNHIMGHVDDSMAAEYREKISDERLLAVTDHIHRWLFDSDGDSTPDGEATQTNNVEATQPESTETESEEPFQLRVVG